MRADGHARMSVITCAASSAIDVVVIAFHIVLQFLCCALQQFCPVHHVLGRDAAVCVFAMRDVRFALSPVAHHRPCAVNAYSPPALARQ